ncbi:DUF2730 family protein [Vibrio mediterranei]
MESWIDHWWPIVWAGVISAVQVVQILLAKTYARRDDMESMRRDMDEMQAKIEHLPTDDEMHELQLELERVRGEITELRAELKPVNHLTKLLLEQRLNDD